MSQHFDAVVIGAGQAGPPLAERLGRAREACCRDRAKSRRWHLRQHGLHTDQGHGGQCLCGTYDASGV